MGVAVASASPGYARGTVPEEAAAGANDVYVQMYVCACVRMRCVIVGH